MYVYIVSTTFKKLLHWKYSPSSRSGCFLIDFTNEGKEIPSRAENIGVCACVYIYIYVHTHTHFLSRSLYNFWLKKSLMPLKISHLRKTSRFSIQKRRGLERALKLQFDSTFFQFANSLPLSHPLFFSFSSPNSYVVSTRTYIKREWKKFVSTSSFHYRFKLIFHSETDERI